MKKAIGYTLFGFFLAFSVCVIWAIPIMGPTHQHRQDGVIEIKDDSGFNAIDPKTSEVVSKSMRPMGIRVFLDVEENKAQYVTWKSNRLFDFDVHYHLNKNDKSQTQAIQSKEAWASFWSFYLGPFFSGIMTGIGTLIICIFVLVVLHS